MRIHPVADNPRHFIPACQQAPHLVLVRQGMTVKNGESIGHSVISRSDDLELIRQDGGQVVYRAFVVSVDKVADRFRNREQHADESPEWGRIWKASICLAFLNQTQNCTALIL